MSSSEARRIHIEAWQTSGMSQAAYCREHGLNTKTFSNWVRKHRADHVLELPSTVSPYWLGELLKCL
jgi:transposase-like protein